MFTIMYLNLSYFIIVGRGMERAWLRPSWMIWMKGRARENAFLISAIVRRFRGIESRRMISSSSSSGIGIGIWLIVVLC